MRAKLPSRQPVRPVRQNRPGVVGSFYLQLASAAKASKHSTAAAEKISGRCSTSMKVPSENKAAKRNMIAWGFATLVPDENARRNHCRAFALRRNETRLLSLMSALRVNSGTSQTKDRPKAVSL
jgi:hypothetical protein